MKWINIIGGVLCAAAITYGSFAKPAPKPVPVGVSACLTDFRVRLHSAWTEGAAKTFETDTDAKRWIDEQGIAAFKGAFAPVRQREQDALGEKYDDAVRQKLWATFAEESK